LRFVPSVNKQSLREEFTALKERFGQLSTDGKVGAESRALIEALLMLMHVLMAVFMEKHTPKSSTNSSKPSSQTEKDQSAISSGTHTKGKPYDPSRSANTPFTNNRAERDLCMSKVKQKVSDCFRKVEFAQAYCRISSYLQTMANQGYDPLIAIQMALSGQLYAEIG
jgi:hypothetical protein